MSGGNGFGRFLYRLNEFSEVGLVIFIHQTQHLDPGSTFRHPRHGVVIHVVNRHGLEVILGQHFEHFEGFFIREQTFQFHPSIRQFGGELFQLGKERSTGPLVEMVKKKFHFFQTARLITGRKFEMSHVAWLVRATSAILAMLHHLTVRQRFHKGMDLHAARLYSSHRRLVVEVPSR